MLQSDAEAAAGVGGVGDGMMAGSQGGGLSGLITQTTPTSTRWALSPTWGSGWQWRAGKGAQEEKALAVI